MNKVRTKKSQNRIKFLFILLILTAILSITATYAWFSTQRDVEIVGMRLNVEVAESLQISLDGKTWVQAINITNMRQFYGTWHDTATHQAYTSGDGKGNTNYVPTELLPVSTDGTVTNGILQFVQGTIIGKKLTSISACNETSLASTNDVAGKEGNDQANNKYHPYLVFDMYLRNVSAKTGTNTDTLLLNKGSHVWADTTTGSGTEEGTSTANTGLEYSARVGFILYDNTVSITEGDTSGGQTVDEKVRGITTGSTNKVAIWEPNDKEHTQYVVNNDTRITELSQVWTTYPIQSTKTSGEVYDVTKTSSQTDNASTTGVNEAVTVAAAGTEDADLASGVVTMKPDYSLTTWTNDNGTTTDATDDVVEAAGTKAASAITYTDGSTTMELKPNTMSRVRVYIWLEGQDPDCVDLASTGGKLDIDIKLTKNPTEKNTTTYTGSGAPAGGGS